MLLTHIGGLAFPPSRIAMSAALAGAPQRNISGYTARLGYLLIDLAQSSKEHIVDATCGYTI